MRALHCAVVVCGVLLSMASAVRADDATEESLSKARLWYDATGTHSVKASLVAVQDGNVVLRRSDTGQEVSLPIDKLSDADQKYLKRLATKKANGADKTATVNKADAKGSAAKSTPAAPEPPAAVAAPNPTPETKSDGAALKMNVTDLPSNPDKMREFHQAHAGEAIELTGIVLNMSAGGTKGQMRPYVVLSTAEDRTKEFSSYNFDSRRMIECDTAGWQPWKNCNTSSQITIRGKVDRNTLVECTLVAAAGKAVPSFTAQKCWAAYQKSPQDFAKTYKGKCLIVSGVVEGFGKENAEYGSGPLFLKVNGSKKIKVNYGFPPQFKDVKVGDEITVLSTNQDCNSLNDEAPLVLGECCRIDLLPDAAGK